MINRREFVAGAGAVVASSWSRAGGSPLEMQADAGGGTALSVDATRSAGSLPHFWEKAAGSDRTVVGLREQWRQDLVRVQKETGIQSVRCHGLFDDEMGIAAAGPGNFNFLYVDQIYDFMLDHGVRPFVELSFMPEAFASSANRIFAYKGNVSPPRNWQDWHNMVQAFTEHCVKRYGLAEVRGWKFEVWNEPNISFWAGSQQEYFELFKQSAAAIKKVDSQLQVGGPSTAQLGWIPDLIAYCAQQNVSIDFVSTHVYPDDPQKYIFGKDHLYSFEQVIPRGVEHVKRQVESSKMPHLPLWITEWSSQNPAFIADTVKNCIGLAEAMSYWTFSNVFEEGGVPSGIFNGTFGMLDQWGIARPSFHAFVFLHKLGESLLQSDAGPVLATRRADGSVVILIWNLIPAAAGGVANGNPMGATGGANESKGATKLFRLKMAGVHPDAKVMVRQVNGEVGTAIPKWREMGSPKYPTSSQISELRSAAELPKPEVRPLSQGPVPEFSMELPANGIALLEMAR
ncbi:MAG TPA: glycosyl hydrolase family 39 [Terracidiphilus sp.]